MPTVNIFSGSVSATTPMTQSAVATGNTLTAAQFINNVNVVPATGAGTALTAPTGVALGAYFFARGGISVGDSFTFVNQTSDGFASTLSGGVGSTLIGSGATAATAGFAARFVVRCTAAPTDAAGTGATFSIYRAN